MSKIPEVFSRFNNYNCPEKHKHRKRSKGNLSSSVLSMHSAALCDYLQSSWMKKEQFKGLFDVVQGLVASLSTYISYLHEKVKYQKMHHEVMHSSTASCDSSHLEFLPTAKSTATSLLSLQREIGMKDPYVPVAVNDFAPTDRKQRYRYELHTLKRPLCSQCQRSLDSSEIYMVH